ncbi:DNA repair helicase XPB2, putative [Entamoeba invadens IP1]|uniref:DNA 3'-5' helicase n=1 Tax=Entamoeba invadens IP1 TaxID=370355 RepID=A0A0A1U8W8_ENTIV|nr:DNA repair helicase XPB2, putative [Entamoeba invadens IP1]ELP91292.1 DNA repair helicase XPB2, putative [Entamoeba invadens IP1]|eukprot:XP_004258063.1 DNA repair helicase XPB2, putative [Entamoeba invadens IP1]
MSKKRDDDEASSEDIDGVETGFVESDMKLKANHLELPMWVCTQSRIFVETSSDLFDEVSELLNRVAEAASRLKYIHEYRLTDNSIMTAFSFGMTPEELIISLDKYSKNILPDNVKSQIRQVGEKNQNLRLVLINGKYYLQAETEDQLKNVLDEKIKTYCNSSITEVKEGEDLYKDLDLNRSVCIVEIKPECVFKLKKRCKKKKRNTRIYEEYHFLKDKQKELFGELRSDCLHPHQAKALQQMFDNEIARSGIIVLPCGSGKTLTAIAACMKIKRSAVVIGNSTQSVLQWKNEFLRWSTVKAESLKLCISDKKEQLGDDACILFTTYSMLSFSGTRQYDGQRIVNDLMKREWGMIIFDEVQSAPTERVRDFCNGIKAQCKLGLTATLVREDKNINELEFMIGPKLYEASWQDLANQGYIAKAKCFEILCPMSTSFYTEYVSAEKNIERRLLSVMNSNKVDACKFLVKQHLAHGDKVIIFCDDLAPASYYSKKLNCVLMDGKTQEEKRRKILDGFRNGEHKVVLFTRVADVSIDLPDASVAIQLSSNGASRRQEAQRLGRILRAKKGAASNRANAYFYTLTSQDTREMYFSQKRQHFLLDKGYVFKTINLQKIMPLKPENKKQDQIVINNIINK